ncbi:MAG: ABC transporter permease [Flavobacteriales bacterium]|jgi:peptide/nickel transport system permease protein
MLKFILKKIGYSALVLWGVVTLVFFLFNLSPADPVRNLVGENAPESVVKAMQRKLDLDLPLTTRYVLYVNDLSPISFHASSDTNSRVFFDAEKYSGLKFLPLPSSNGLYLKAPYLKRSFLSERNVSEILSDVIPGTALLAILSIILAMFFGVFLGVIAAIKKDTWIDRMLLFVSALGMAGPSFFVAILVAWIGAVLWRDSIPIPFTDWSLPGTGLNMTGSLYSVDVWKGEYLNLQNLILPLITLAVRPLAVIVQLTRSSLLEVMSMDFIRTARAKGLSESQVILKHALRNSLNPVVTAVSGWFASLLAGAVFVEFVFGWKGLGQEMFTAIEKQDLPVVMGGVIVISFAFVLINLLVDAIYKWIDPRV